MWWAWWIVIFGGILVGALCLYALLALWLWHRARDLAGELERAASRAEQVLDGVGADPAATAVGSTDNGGAHRG